LFSFVFFDSSTGSTFASSASSVASLLDTTTVASSSFTSTSETSSSTFFFEVEIFSLAVVFFGSFSSLAAFSFAVLVVAFLVVFFSSLTSATTSAISSFSAFTLALLTIFFSQMIQQLYDYADKAGGKLPEKTFFILDEFANIGQIPDFDKKISTSRSRGISFSVILQNLDQLEAVYEKSYETIIGNCDTHVFLGSNSTKTLEYFSKALGEKTISRDSHSTNRDKGGWKSGSSDSDQIMGRALLTPDELRRFDNDMCIIFVKGVRPVKANKFYYFRHPMGKEMARLEISHNDAEVGERGEWRIFNPANPYSASSETKAQDLKVESLDDLFADDEPSEPKNNTEDVTAGSTSSGVDQNLNTVDAPKPKSKPMEIPLEDNDEEVNNLDLEKALEAKFDELFGTDDD